MARYLIRRILLAVLTMFAVSVVTFLLFFAVPTSPAYVMCGKQCDAHAIAQTEHRLGLDQPTYVQYGQFMKGMVAGRTYGTGDLAVKCPAPCLGFSFRTNEPVTDIIKRTVPVTVSIVVGALVIQTVLGVGLGMISALKRGSVFDKTAVGVSLVGASMQIYFFGPILLLIFVYSLHVLPNPGYTSPFDDPAQWFTQLLLPWATLGFLNSAIYARLSRAQMLETLSEDFVRTARAKGLPKRKVYARHALRAAITPIVTIAGLDLGGALGGAVITETVFGVNGLGRTAVQAVNDLNLPVVMGTVLLAAFFIIVMNIIVDVLYSVIDPRVRLG
ncbi:ABC transporter permease [Actinocatenispora sera]|uniref:ABC transporter permease n=1 Tax=Actinocatenispora sera TaxID=390989 RepID=A0A810KU37_9ACTN|nr:ABC transporter permease [Actinocatenispora sera]BCJ25972.1 ABC transporter permease [Actinocatenispora sera]